MHIGIRFQITNIDPSDLKPSMPPTSPVRVCRTRSGYHPTQGAYFPLPDAGSHQPVHSSPTNHPICPPSPATTTPAPVRSQVHGRCIARPNCPYLTPPRPTDAESSHFPVSRDSAQTTLGSRWDRSVYAYASYCVPPPPLCTVHQEPAKEFWVNKHGPNEGKTFYLCAWPGPGYDKGRHERLREEVDHHWQYKCNFFMWASDAMRCELLLPLLPLTWWVQRVKGRIVVGF